MQRSSRLAPAALGRSATRSVLLASAAWGIATGLAAPAAQAASSMFSEQAVNPQQFVVMAAPRNAVDYNLVILEQKSSQRDCWTESNGIVNPLLLNFDFSGICGRATDSNGYSVRMAGQDLGLQYSLRLVNRGNYVALLAAPSRRNQPVLEIGRTKTAAQDYLAVTLQPGWELSRRVYNGKALGHIYLSNAQALANTIAAAPTPPLLSAPAKPVAPPVVPPPVAPKPLAKPNPLEIVSIGTPLPQPPRLPGRPSTIQRPIAQAPIAQAPIAQAPIALPVELPPSPAPQPSTSRPSPVRPGAIANPLASQPHYARLNALYREILDRDVDASGLKTYGDRLERGKTIDWVRDRLRNSQEGQALAINRLYREVLGRDVDPSGLAVYQQRMRRGWTLSQVRRDIAGSDEAQARLASR